MDTGSRKMSKHRRAADLELDTEEPEIGTMTMEAALEQAERWIEQWDWTCGCGTAVVDMYLLRSTPAHDRRGKWRQGVWGHNQKGSRLDQGDPASYST